MKIGGDYIMTTYIALLRGINVGGKNIIKMAELKRLFESIGLSNVKTYIQSGNVLFKSAEAEEVLVIRIEKAIETTFGFSVHVILRTAAELEKIIIDCPFTEKEISEAEEASKVESLYVSLMSHEPLKEKVESLNIYTSENDRFVIIGREVFLLFKHSVRDSKLASNLHKLGVACTVRNWKTINKLVSIARDLEG